MIWSNLANSSTVEKLVGFGHCCEHVLLLPAWNSLFLLVIVFIHFRGEFMEGFLEEVAFGLTFEERFFMDADEVERTIFL